MDALPRVRFRLSHKTPVFLLLLDVYVTSASGLPHR